MEAQRSSFNRSTLMRGFGGLKKSRMVLARKMKRRESELEGVVPRTKNKSKDSKARDRVAYDS